MAKVRLFAFSGFKARQRAEAYAAEQNAALPAPGAES